MQLIERKKILPNGTNKRGSGVLETVFRCLPVRTHLFFATQVLLFLSYSLLLIHFNKFIFRYLHCSIKMLLNKNLPTISILTTDYPYVSWSTICTDIVAEARVSGEQVALFDISISNIDCQYIDTFEKYRYRYRHQHGHS